MKNNVLSILVVLYNKELLESATIKSLLNIDVSLSVNLTIVNNGPSSLLDVGLFKESYSYLFDSIKISEFLENKPLSMVYNYFLSQSMVSDYFLFFDDDSIFDASFLEYVSRSDADVILPRIKSCDDNKFYYPESNNEIIEEECVLCVKNIMSIASGLTLSKNIILTMSKHYSTTFDEHFALYGIDTSFFLRLSHVRSLDNNISVICNGILYHSLSRAGNQPITDFRLKERLCDAALIARHYPSKKRVVYFFKKIIQNICFLKQENVLLLIKCYISGKHPRCK
ncbi:glycosyltransferase [Buttiauxella noackiae]|uniref:glycosyltransferase n=1 Tax=Buttiauxella noackiae TaxID=82992 RepID=UPI0012FEF76A|nr:glycosyltransferase [Buttiauxella noackiae]